MSEYKGKPRRTRLLTEVELRSRLEEWAKRIEKNIAEAEKSGKPASPWVKNARETLDRRLNPPTM